MLAQIYVAAGATAIITDDITDKRPDGTVCGWVVSTVQSIDLTQVLAQSTAQFNTWFATIQGILGEDEAAALLAMIQANAADIEDLQEATETVTKVMAPENWDANKVYSFAADFPNDEYDIWVGLNADATSVQETEAWASAMIVGSATTNTVKAFGDKPTIELHVQVKATKKLGGA